MQLVMVSDALTVVAIVAAAAAAAALVSDAEQR